MIVYDKEQKEIVIPNGIGNINLFNNGVEAGYNQGYEQGQADMAANARVLNVTENGVYRSKYSDPIVPDTYTVTGVYDDGTEFYSYAELNGKVFNTKIAGSVDSRLEFWYKGDNTLAGDAYNVIIGSGNNDDSDCFQVRYVTYTNNNLSIGVGNSIINFGGWDDTVWHHLIISKEEGLWIDGKKKNWDFSPTNTVNGEFFINGINYDINSDRAGTRNANGYFGMIKIDDVVIIPTADGFKNVNTGELLEVVKDGGYTFRENDPIYGEGELYKTIIVDVPDLNGSYDEGYAQGKTDGINEQKSKLESINITENGTYRKEDGYNEVVVNVPDLNGSYDEGYEQGQADVAANARVLDVTENGNYLSKFSDPVAPTLVTGRYADGTDFYNYATLSNQVYNTNITVTKDSVVELWYKGDNETTDDGWNTIFGCAKTDDEDFYLGYMYSDNTNLRGFIGQKQVQFSWDDNVWHHIIMKNDGLWVDDVLMGSFNTTKTFAYNLGLNGTWDGLIRNANGCFGMIKIDNTIIIPTAGGFQNVNTGELLEVVKNGSYSFTENKIRYGEGELYKTVNVNVIPKINVKEAEIKFGESTFTEVPEWADFKDVTDFSYMFRYCNNLQTIPEIDTSNAINMDSMFNGCGNLTTVPAFDTSSVTNMGSMFYECGNLTTVPAFDTSNVTNMYQMFFIFVGNKNLVSLPKFNCQKVNEMGRYFSYYDDGMSALTDVGGWENLKCDWNDDNGLATCPNLTYQSCINILNGLYDFVGNGSTETRTLKVHPNFLTTVGDKISIGTAKGWSISAG